METTRTTLELDFPGCNKVHEWDIEINFRAYPGSKGSWHEPPEDPYVEIDKCWVYLPSIKKYVASKRVDAIVYEYEDQLLDTAMQSDWE